MTKREGAILTIYTGIMLGELDYVYKVLKEIEGRPVYTHEMGNQKFMNKMKEKVKDEFVFIMENQIE